MGVLFIAPFINKIIPSYTCAYNRMDVIVWKGDSSVHFLEYYNNAVMDGPILSLFKCFAYIFNQIFQRMQQLQKSVNSKSYQIFFTKYKIELQFHEPTACILLRDQGNWGLNGKLLFKCSIPSIWDLASEAGPQVSQYQFITRGLIYNISKLCIINCWLRGRHMERSGVNLKFYFRLCAKYFYFPIIHKSYLKDKYLCCCPLCIDTGGHHDTPLSAIKSVAMGGSRRSQEH